MTFAHVYNEMQKWRWYKWRRRRCWFGFSCFNVVGFENYRFGWNDAKAITRFKVICGHHFWYHQSRSRMRRPFREYAYY